MAVAAAAAAVVTLPANAVAAAPPVPAGWSQVFLDDFNGPSGSGVNTADWQYTTGTSYPGGPAGFGTGEVETMTANADNVSLDGSGNLRITPRRDAAGNWTSGRVETRRSDFQAPAGGKLRTEARIQMPNVTGPAAKGYWPAFWMLGAPYRGNWWNWPGVGELDILENVQGINNEWATMHCGTSPGGPCNEKSGIGGQHVCTGTTCQGGFHTYALEWDRSTPVEEMRFYLDGFNFHTVRADQMDAVTWTNATNHGYFIILNVAMGGEFPAAFGGGPDAGTQPGHPMVVDYVSVLRPTGGTSTPPTGEVHGAPGQPPPGRPVHLARTGRLGRAGDGVRVARPGAAGEGHGPGGGVVDGLGEVGQEDGGGPGGVGGLLGQQLEAHQLEGLGVAGQGQFLGPGEVPGHPGVDEPGGHPGAAQQPAGRFGGTQLAPPGEVAGGGAVRFQPEQRRTPAAQREAGLGVEEGGAGRGRAGRVDQLGLEGGEAQLRAEHSLAVLVHQGRRFDHPGIPLRT
ncbi:glycoside hydrolase family 16 protein [Streptomyces sp. ICC1]|uniref:glycoside hydrolase family 16 protein n=1 Tax=Streptomyces sp. ICC1 TaxID=2099583 RepID=UPI001EF76C7C|nr:glycoside hydrolase family 16 protein [Streptomyces sp. ICC1]